MGKKRNIPVYNRGNAARQTQRKYLGSKMTQVERVQKNREAAGHVISMCFLVALNNRYGIGEERLGRVTDAANAELERFDLEKRAVGMEKAKKRLAGKLGELLPNGFILPATKTPRREKDWAMLGEQREAAEIVVGCYALAAHKALSFRAGSGCRGRWRRRSGCSGSSARGPRAGTTSGMPSWPGSWSAFSARPSPWTRATPGSRFSEIRWTDGPDVGENGRKRNAVC